MSSASRAHNSRASVSHGRSASTMSTSNSFRNGVLSGLNGAAPIPEHPPALHSIPNHAPRDREPSPTLPNLPSHPTLNSLISSQLSSPNLDEVPSDPAILAIGGPIETSESVGSPPRIGDPGKRMLGAALGVRHPGLGPRVIGQKPSSSGPSPVAVTAE